jgi:hypothetical protein
VHQPINHTIETMPQPINHTIKTMPLCMRISCPLRWTSISASKKNKPQLQKETEHKERNERTGNKPMTRPMPRSEGEQREQRKAQKQTRSEEGNQSKTKRPRRGKEQAEKRRTSRGRKGPNQKREEKQSTPATTNKDRRRLCVE